MHRSKEKSVIGGFPPSILINLYPQSVSTHRSSSDRLVERFDGFDELSGLRILAG